MASRRKSKGEEDGATSALQVVGGANLPAAWEERFKGYVEDETALATGDLGWAYISTRLGQLRFQKEPLEGPLKVIILGARRENRGAGQG